MNDYLIGIIRQSLEQFDLEDTPEVQIEEPNLPEHGDASSNIAMKLAKPLKNNPRVIAQQIVDGLKIDEKKISSVEIAGPGFINFRFFNPEKTLVNRIYTKEKNYLLSL